MGEPICGVVPPAAASPAVAAAAAPAAVAAAAAAAAAAVAAAAARLGVLNGVDAERHVCCRPATTFGPCPCLPRPCLVMISGE